MLSLTDFSKHLRSFWSKPVVRAFRTSPSGIIGLTIVTILLGIAIIAPFFLNDAAQKQNFSAISLGSSWHYPLGTDTLGRNVFIRLLVGARLSLLLALAAAAIALALGLALGASAAVLGKRSRALLLRVIDTMISFPGLLVVIVITVVLGKGEVSVLMGVGIAFSFQYARLVSTLAMSVGAREYINAARVLGVKGPRLLMRYVLPNIAEPLTIAFSAAVATAILIVSALSFLGIGVQPPSFDWGQMLQDYLPNIYTTPLQALVPALAIALAALGFGLMGEAMARSLNPLLWTSQKSRKGRRRLAFWTPKEIVPAAPTASANGAAAVRASAGTPAPLASSATDPNGQVALHVEDLVVTFPTASGPVDIVKGVSFTVGKGEALGIVGESGSGKTMTALAVAQLTQFPGHTTGKVMLHGQELGKLPRSRLDRFLGTDLAFVFQDPMSSLNPAIRIGAQVTEAIRVHKKIRRKKANEMAVAGLSELHIPAAARQIKRYPHEFSGGMRQRVMIAKGLIKEPTLIIADEPTTALDVTVQAQIMDVLHEINQSHETAIVLISHNLALVSQSCHRVIVMYSGRIVEELYASQLLDNALHPYTRALLEAVPEFGYLRGRKLQAIPGEIPDITSPPSGCPYHPRCPLAIDRCRTELPALVTRPGTDGRRVACHVANSDLS